MFFLGCCRIFKYGLISRFSTHCVLAVNCFPAMCIVTSLFDRNSGSSAQLLMFGLAFSPKRRSCSQWWPWRHYVRNTPEWPAAMKLTKHECPEVPVTKYRHAKRIAAIFALRRTVLFSISSSIAAVLGLIYIPSAPLFIVI